MEREHERAGSRTPFVGRDRELALLIGGLKAAAGGHGHLFIISGEPGVGKTRLLEEVASVATARGALSVWGRCWEGDGAPPLWPWVQILRTLLQREEGLRVARGDARASALIASLDAPLAGTASLLADPPAWERLALYDGVAAFLRRVAGRRPLALLLDDLHAARLPSLLLLEILARDLWTVPLLIVAAYTDADTRAGVFGDRFGALARDSTAIPLHALGPASARALVAAVAGREPSPGLFDKLHTATGGNPFFLDEMVRLLIADGGFDDRIASRQLGIPDRVRSALRARLAPLPQVTRAALEAAASVGLEFDFPLLGDLLGCTTEEAHTALSPALSAGLIRPLVGGAFHFAHAVVRETIYEDVPATRRISLHCRIGAALETRHGDRSAAVLAALAHHFFQGQPDADAARARAYAAAAGQQALQLCAYEDATAYFAQALALLDRGGVGVESEPAELHLALAGSALRAGDVARAKQAVRDAAAEGRRLGSASLIARAALALRFAVDARAADAERIGLLHEALARLGSDDSALRARALAQLAWELCYTDDAARREALSREAVAVARRLGDPTVHTFALATRCFVLWGLRGDDERLPLAAELLELARQSGDRELAIEAHHWRVIDTLALGDLPAVDREIEAAAELAAALRQPRYRWWCALWRSMRAALAGRFTEAEQLAEEARAIGARVQPVNAEAAFAGQMSMLLWQRGEVDRLVGILEAVHRDHQTDYPEISAGMTWALAEAGRAEDARRELANLAAGGFEGLRPAPGRLPALAVLAEAVGLLGDAERGETLYALLRPYAGRNVVIGAAHGWFGPTDRLLGLLATLRQDWETAESHFASALAASRKVCAPAFVALTQFNLAGMYVARGRDADRAQADALLAETLETAERLDMRGLAERATRVRAELGASTAPAPPTGDPAFNLLAQEGEYWTFRYRGSTCRLRHRAGMRYLSRLLEQPHVDVPALELAAVPDTPAGDRDDARHREEPANPEVGGQVRRAGSPAERARVRVTRAVREVIDRIRAVDTRLGAHLARSVRTGRVCRYAPSQPTTWAVERLRPATDPTGGAGHLQPPTARKV